MEEKKKSVVKSNVSYDERRKIMTHTTEEERETEFGTLKTKSEGTYEEKGIRAVVKNLEEKRKVIKSNLQILEKLKEETPKMTPELQYLKDQLQTLQKIDHDEKVNPKEKEKEAADLKNNLEELKKVEKDIKDIKDSIGTRLKF